MGVGTFAETDVYAGARVFTGWNLARPGSGAAQHYAFNYNPAEHETTAKEFTFPIYPDGGKTIPARAAASGMQDGLDLITAVARHPATGPRLARKLYDFFVNEVDAPDDGLDRSDGRRVLRQRLRDRSRDAGAAPLTAVPRSEQLLQALQLAGGVRGAGAQGSWMGGVLGERRCSTR